MQKFSIILTLLFCSVVALAQSPAPMPHVRVAANQRTLETQLTGQAGAESKPFFWLGDTAWELFHRLNREEAIEYLDTRKAQGFNVIQAVALAEFDGLRKPNAYGDLPLVELDPNRLDVTPGNNPKDGAEYDYWDHVDFVIKAAAERGLYIGLLPTWGDKVAHLWGDGPIVFDEKNARACAKTIAERYKNKPNVLWILGGDRPAKYKGNDGKEYDDRPIWRAMAGGIQEAYGEQEVFITYHPWGGENSTTQYIHNEPWLDMNSFQSGHGSREARAWDWVERDLKMTPPKPSLDMEPCYEDHPVNPWDGKWTRQRGYFTAYDVRARIWRGVLAGGCGVTYGHHFIWQFCDPAKQPPINNGDTIIHWRQALKAPAANQLVHLVKLMEYAPFAQLKADNSIILSNNPAEWDKHQQAMLAEDGSFAMVYLPENQAITVDLKKIAGGQKRVQWYDPRTGKTVVAKQQKTQTFTPPKMGRDWVLVVEGAAKKGKS
ncbi:MAG: glycoside hydrolase family 140 protein [Saprospiraceae bacterium]|nr:glycoside hydrolase family 140 protein [Saprospiraceae bacterium]